MSPAGLLSINSIPRYVLANNTFKCLVILVYFSDLLPISIKSSCFTFIWFVNDSDDHH
jgi:hypothetical protein